MTTLLAPPEGLLPRVRWMFAGFTAVIALLWAVQIAVDPPADAPIIAGLAVSAALAGWSVQHYHRLLPVAVGDAVVVLLLLALTLLLPDPGWVFGPAFLVVFQRTLDSRGAHAWAFAVVIYAIYELAEQRGGIGRPLLSVSSFTTLASFLLAAGIMRTLSTAARRHELAAHAERILAAGAARLLSTRDMDAVARTVADAALELAGQPGTSSSYWQVEGGDTFSARAVAGDRILERARVDLCELPAAFRDALAPGRPFEVDDTMLASVRDGLGIVGQAGEHVVAAPIVREGRLSAGIVLVTPETLPPTIFDSLLRFAHETALAIDRVELLDELTRANDELRRADELKTRFVSTVSHELRTPLTAICGFAETLTGQWDRLADSDRLRFISVIARQAGRQKTMIEDLLSMSRILAGRLDPSPQTIDLGEVVARSMEGVGFPVDVAVDDGLEVHCDPHHLEQVLVNLLTNAAKYGRPPYHLRATDVGGDTTMAVIDHGDGVAVGFRDEMFRPFTQADAGDQRTSVGVGLGLTICRDLLAANGSTIRYEDTPGGGATFVVTVPSREG